VQLTEPKRTEPPAGQTTWKHFENEQELDKFYSKVKKLLPSLHWYIPSRAPAASTASTASTASAASNTVASLTNGSSQQAGIGLFAAFSAISANYSTKTKRRGQRQQRRPTVERHECARLSQRTTRLRQSQQLIQGNEVSLPLRASGGENENFVPLGWFLRRLWCNE